MNSISVFDIIKIGVGPSSSHTMGPWHAAMEFLKLLRPRLNELKSMQVSLYGSLAKTGKGHGTDYAVLMGLCGYDYRYKDTNYLLEQYDQLIQIKKILIDGSMSLDLTDDFIVFHYDITHEIHPNALKFEAFFDDDTSINQLYFSLGGGFISTLESPESTLNRSTSEFPCHHGKDILKFCDTFKWTIPELIRHNESTWLSQSEIEAQCLYLWEEMKKTIWRGLNNTGNLPGILKVKRRASDLYQQFTKGIKIADFDEFSAVLKLSDKSFAQVNQWISCFALAVNEENAAYGRVVTSPTNGACGVIPAVLCYAYHFLPQIGEKEIIDFILVAGEIGTLFKKNATISAAMGGCQAEIGVSSAMAAAALCQISGGSPAQVLMAAEIAMEHHLGLTCDPVAGLVQIPCIERNSMGAMKAITAANIAIVSDASQAKVSLDNVINTMWQTAQDMSLKYKETSEAGLASNISVNLIEC
ncbi:MAG: L-serine ammonia-lyase [Chitinophagales bacterium]|jgi:L-serine dehydratase|nr:L-serine ammonia-lyase [Chitinophagales bacterium]